MANVYRITEEDLRNIVKQVINEIGDTHQYGKYGLAKDCATKAKNIGRGYQSEVFNNYAADEFDKKYGYDKNGNKFRMTRDYYKPIYKDEHDNYFIYGDDSRINNAIKAKMRNSKTAKERNGEKGLDLYDNVKKSQFKW